MITKETAYHHLKLRFWLRNFKKNAEFDEQVFVYLVDGADKTTDLHMYNKFISKCWEDVLKEIISCEPLSFHVFLIAINHSYVSD